VTAPQTRASLGFLADMVPSAVVQAAGRAGAGTSLDNAMRFGPEPATTGSSSTSTRTSWRAAYAHGAGKDLVDRGTLLAIASQTRRLLLFD